jgi:hypothetical protein
MDMSIPGDVELQLLLLPPGGPTFKAFAASFVLRWQREDH